MNCPPCAFCAKQPGDCKCAYYKSSYKEFVGSTKKEQFIYVTLPNVLLYLLPVLVTGYLFGDVVNNSSTVLFSNDGPLGLMASQSMSDAAPGVSYWNDLYWLGSNGGVHPVSLSYIIIWLLRGYNWLLIPSGVFFIWRFKKLWD